MYSGICLFKTAFMNTRRQICVSGIFLVAITCVLTVILYLAESRVDSDFSFWDALSGHTRSILVTQVKSSTTP